MVIGKGTSYGSPCEIDPRWPSLAGDSAVAAHIAMNGGAPCTVIDGDLLRTLGGGAPPGVRPLAYPVDLLEVELDGQRTAVAVAHVVGRRVLWSGQFLAAMNAAWLGDLYLGPRSHPNDGLVDVTTGTLSWQQRWMARRRAVTGTHLPHPALSVTRSANVTHRFDRPTPVWIDGVRVGRATEIVLSVRPDAGVVVV